MDGVAHFGTTRQESVACRALARLTVGKQILKKYEKNKLSKYNFIIQICKTLHT
jgi:hypothetical protein